MRYYIFTTLFLAIFSQAAFTQPTLTVTPVITGLDNPMQFVNAGDGTERIFIVQKAGTILVYNKDYALLDTFLKVTTNLSVASERGLLSLAFHPGYATNGFFYIYYTNTAGSLEISRYKVSNNPNVADPATRVIVKTIPHPNNANHNGGELHFGKDGFLYLSTGDGGGAGDVPNNSQNTAVLLGKILRFAVNTSNTAPYFSIPADNPFGNEVYAYGLRNPFRWSFDRLTNDMWIGDVGQSAWEEFNFRPVDSSMGVNYGWRCYEGNATYNTTVGCAGPISNYIFPVYSYPNGGPLASASGGNVYRGNTFLDLKGYYIGADFYSGVFYKIIFDSLNHNWLTYPQAMPASGISDFGETEDGEILVVSLIGNTVYRLSASGPIGYVFKGSGNWNDPANWSNGQIPPSDLPSGSEIIIDPPLGEECVLNTLQNILPGAKITVQENKIFRIEGDLNIQ